jgi:hypothetical protein
LLLVALLIAVGAFVLWLELLIRAAAVYVAVLFLPLALATLVWPAVSHWCRRLVETLAALILSKFVIVATLSLAVGAVASGTAGTGNHGSGFSSVLAGGALLLMATFVPFAILRMIPAVEAGAVAHLDGLRARGVAGMTRLPRTAANFALHEGLGMVGDSRLMAGTAAAGGLGGGGGAGDGDGAGGDGDGAGAGGTSSGTGITLGDGDPSSQRNYEEGVAAGIRPPPKGEKPLLAAPTSGSGGTEPGATAAATGFEPDPVDRVGARKLGGLGARLGPDTKEDAWMWAGVPPGGSLVRRYEPGERRYYMADDGGPSLKSLPRAWPQGQGPDA